MTPLRIVHTESSLGWGGQEMRILAEAQGLARRGHAVTLLCPAEARIHAESAHWGVPVVALPIARKRLRGLRALRDWLAAHPADVVNTHSSTDSWLAALALRWLGRRTPIVRTRHISAPVAGNFANVSDSTAANNPQFGFSLGQVSCIHASDAFLNGVGIGVFGGSRVSENRAASNAEGIRASGGTPIEFNTISVTDGIAMGTEGMKASLVSREAIADSVELVVRGHLLDGFVAISGCDKTIPAMVMAMARLDLPSVMLYGGSIMYGEYKGKRMTVQDVFEAIGAQVLRMTPENHDAAFASVSHLPHLLAFAYFSAVVNQPAGRDFLSRTVYKEDSLLFNRKSQMAKSSSSSMSHASSASISNIRGLSLIR